MTLLPGEVPKSQVRCPKAQRSYYLAMIKQFLNDVVWGDLDYLIVDTPPGTSDEHISITEHLMQDFHVKPKAVLVTTPQVWNHCAVEKLTTGCVFGRCTKGNQFL